MNTAQRIAPRKDIQIMVYLQDEFGRDLFAFESMNISLSGLFIKTDIVLHEGYPVFLRLQLSADAQQLMLSARVTRQMEQRRGPGRKKTITKGLGLRFIGLTPPQLGQLQAFMNDAEVTS